MALDLTLEKRIMGFLEKVETQSITENMKIDFYLRYPNLGLKGAEDIQNPNVLKGLNKFKIATGHKIFAQQVKFTTDDATALEKASLRAMEDYMEILAVCSKEADNKDDERLRRILVMDAYEGLGDILLLQRNPNEGVYYNAISMYTKLKQQALEFLDWGKEHNLREEDIKEAKHIAFTAEMSLASLYICCQELEKSCEETLAALEFVKSFNNLEGIDYCEYIPFSLRSVSYTTKRFSEVPRDNQEQPYEPIMGENPLLRFSDKPEYRYKFIKSILNRRVKSNGSIAGGLFYSRFRANKNEANTWGFDKYGPKFILESMAVDPINEKGYQALFFLENSPQLEDRQLAKVAIDVSNRIRLKKVEIRHFDMVQVHPNYPTVLTDGEVIFKEEPNQEIAKKHVSILNFLRENSELNVPDCELCTSDSGKFYVKLQMVKNPFNGKVEQEFRACSLEDMITLYRSEVRGKNEPTIEEMSEFRKKKLKQIIDVLLQLQNAGEQNKAKIKDYGLEIAPYSYKRLWEKDIIRYLELDDETKSLGEEIIDKLDTTVKIFSHGDFHSGNILFSEENLPIIIDPVQACFASRFRDLANLLEQDSFRDMQWKEKCELVDYYLTESATNNSEITGLRQLYLMEAIYTNLLFAKKTSNPTKFYYSPKRRDEFIKYAKMLIEKLKGL